MDSTRPPSRRATIAAATAHHPLLVLADEPTSALDADLTDDVLRLLRRQANALLLVSHDLDLAARQWTAQVRPAARPRARRKIRTRHPPPAREG
ncbi:hypothetical protein ABGB07_35515 [Micromonosporaceae bacterium B7E4]